MEDFILEQPPISTQDRLRVYQYGYWARLIEVLTSQYEVFKTALESERELDSQHSFGNLAETYLRQNPSRFTEIDEIGRGFLSFLKQQPIFDLYPWLVDLAQLEWLMLEVLFGSTGAVGSFFVNSIQVNPDLRFLESDWDIATLFKDKKKPMQTKTRLLIYRKKEEAAFEHLTLPEFTVLQRLCSGVSIDEALAPPDGDELDPQVFYNWAKKGIVKVNSG